MELQAYKKYSFYLILSLILTTIGTFIGTDLALSDNAFTYGIVSIVIMLLFMFTKGTLKKIMFTMFCLGEGIFLTPIVDYYSSTSLYGCLLATTITVAIFAFIGYKARNLSLLGGMLFTSLICILLYNIVGLFIYLPSISLIIIIVFSLYVSYDMNRFKLAVTQSNGYLSNDEILHHVMDMYLNIINILIHLLSIFGSKDD